MDTFNNLVEEELRDNSIKYGEDFESGISETDYTDTPDDSGEMDISVFDDD